MHSCKLTPDYTVASNKASDVVATVPIENLKNCTSVLVSNDYMIQIK